MISDDFGLLQLPCLPPGIQETALRWRDLPENKTVLFLSLILLLITFKDFSRLFPQLLQCLWRHRENIILEHNISSSQSRNILFLSMLFPVAAVLNRFFNWGYLPMAAGLAFFLFLRILLYQLSRVKLRGEEKRAARRIILNAFIILGPAIIISSLALMFMNVPDRTICIVTMAESGLFYLVSILRTGEIFSSGCSGFSTFLYLCALEFAPAAATAALAVLLF